MHLLPLLLALPLTYGLEPAPIIPEVERAIDQQQALFDDYTAYTEGPTGSAKSVASRPTPKVLAQVVNQQAKVAVAAAAGTPYWYEQITKQGKSAFNSNTNYKVYRNVKDYDAKG